MIIYDLL